ncbi:MAG: peptide/nickel transport system permease protein, partial [Octadecabacter sp.]
MAITLRYRGLWRTYSLQSILKIVLQRLGLGIVTLFIVSVVIFVAVNSLPGDFAEAILGQGATPESVATIRRDLGLDQPLILRYFIWLKGMLTLDLGTSFAQLNFANFGGAGTTTVAEQIAPRLSNTMFLATVTACFAVPLAVTLGVLAALYRNTAFDKAANMFTLSSISSPEFFMAYVLILF